MSQPKKRDIADFFRANARPLPQVPRKRPTPDRDGDLDDDTIVVSQGPIDKTPSTNRFLNREASRNNSRTPTKLPGSSLTTPRSDRSVSIPIRSPGLTASQPHLSSARKPLFSADSRSPQTTPKPAAPFTFPDAPNSSRKVIEDGELVAVRDSDESDDESLISLSELLDRKVNEAPKSSAAQSTSTTRDEDERVRLLSMYTGGRSVPIVDRERMRALQRREKENKFDISSVLDEEREAEESHSRIAQIEAELEETTRELREGKQQDLDKKMLASILQSGMEGADPDELNRLMNAVDRTEALSGEKSFSFFAQTGPRNLSKAKKTKRTFPAKAIPDQLWQPKDITARNRMYLSGFMAEMAHRNRLSDQALRWTYESIPSEPDEDLRQAYLSCVAAASPIWTRANITPQDVQDIFVELGADHASIRDSTVIESRRQFSGLNQNVDCQSLLDILMTFSTTCQDMDFPTLSKLVSLVSRLCLDYRVMLDNRTMQAVEALLRKLVDLPDSLSRQHVHERIVFDLCVNMKEPTLQAQFLTHFNPASAAGMELRTNLAMTFLIGSTKSSKILKPHSKKSPLRGLLDYVTTAATFQITPDTDFQDLAAGVFLVDTAISSGHGTNLNTGLEVNAFNAQVDDLADKIHDLFTSIADAGASHLKKTEAKDTLQALHNRLLYAVRTKPRRKKHVFDTNMASLDGWRVQGPDTEEPDVGGKSYISRFLKPAGTIKEAADPFMDILEA